MMDRLSTPRIIFMGTPEFAVPCLRALLDAGEHVVAVVTQPDRPKGRGQHLAAPPVKALALERGVPVLQPSAIRTAEFLAALTSFRPDLIVVVAYGRILPSSVLTLPKHGCVNVHASLLPAYRGAAPIQWALINGEVETGVCTMMMDVGMDTGDVLLRRACPIRQEDTASELSLRLSELGAAALMETLSAWRGGTLERTVQDHERATMAPLLTKEHGRVRWAEAASKIVDHIRGVTPHPGAFTTAEGETFKIFDARVERLSGVQIVPGHVKGLDAAGRLLVGAGDGVVSLGEIQGPGRRRMPVSEFSRGQKLPEIFESLP